MRLFLILLALALPAWSARAESPELQQVRVSERAALVGRMLAFAVWCNGEQLFLERDRTYRQVLALEPDNGEARKGLRYARNQDGSWKEPAPRPAQNLNKKALELLPARRAEVLKPYRDALLAAYDRESEASRASSTVYADLLALDPDDAVVHARLGEVRDGAAWVLTETVRGRERRAAVRAIVQQALAAPIELQPSAPEGPEAGWADAWTCGVRTERVRVLGTGASADCAALARTLDASVRVAGELFSVPARGPDAFTFYLVPGPARAAFLERNPAFDADQRRFFATAPGGGIPGGTNTALFETEPRRRDDCAVRNALSHVLRVQFKIEFIHGWAFEGLGLYLTRELVGSRLTWYVLAKPDAESLRAGLLAPESNWMKEGLALLTAPNAPALATVLAKPVSALTVADMVVGYVFSAYLVEGCPAEAARFLARTGAGKTADETSREVLGRSMEELGPRLVRWLKERR